MEHTMHKNTVYGICLMTLLFNRVNFASGPQDEHKELEKTIAQHLEEDKLLTPEQKSEKYGVPAIYFRQQESSDEGSEIMPSPNPDETPESEKIAIISTPEGHEFPYVMNIKEKHEELEEPSALYAMPDQALSSGEMPIEPRLESVNMIHTEPTHFKSLQEFNEVINTSDKPLCIVLTNPLDDATAHATYKMKKKFANSIEFIRLDSHRDAAITQTISPILPAFFFMYQGRYAITPITGHISASEFFAHLEQFKKEVATKQEASDVTHKKFHEKIIEQQRTAVIIFTASPGWCRPCEFMESFIQELKAKHKGTIKFKTYFYDKHHDLTDKFNISILPTFVFMQEGKEMYRFSGATNKEAFEQVLTIFDSEIAHNKAYLDDIVKKGKRSLQEDFFIVDFNDSQKESQKPKEDKNRANNIPADLECATTECTIKEK